MVRSGPWWVLAVDFGTTNTVTAVGDANGVRTLTIDGKMIMPSAVLLMVGKLGQGDSWLVGDAAITMAGRRLEWFERTPKSCIPDGTVFLGGQSVPVVDVIVAMLRHVVEEAHKQRGPRAPAGSW
jgi:molecular chaperone DnaK (HSP70)